MSLAASMNKVKAAVAAAVPASGHVFGAKLAASLMTNGQWRKLINLCYTREMTWLNFNDICFITLDAGEAIAVKDAASVCVRVFVPDKWQQTCFCVSNYSKVKNKKLNKWI